MDPVPCATLCGLYGLPTMADYLGIISWQPHKKNLSPPLLPILSFFSFFFFAVLVLSCRNLHARWEQHSGALIPAPFYSFLIHSFILFFWMNYWYLTISHRQTFLVTLLHHLSLPSVLLKTYPLLVPTSPFSDSFCNSFSLTRPSVLPLDQDWLL